MTTCKALLACFSSCRQDYSILMTAPGLTSVGKRAASQLESRIQPALRALPMVLGLSVPWIPIPDFVKPFQMMPTGLFGPAGIVNDSFPRTPVSRSFLSYLQTGSSTLFFKFQIPRGIKRVYPGVMGKLATNLGFVLFTFTAPPISSSEGMISW